MSNERIESSRDAGTVPRPLVVSDATPSPADTLPSLMAPGAGPFPYSLLAAYCRRELSDPAKRAGIETELASSPRWRAHHESVRRFDLEQDAAIQDAADLRQFDATAAGRLCLYAAVSEGSLFERAARRPGDVPEAIRREWSKHVRDCVYCRRMRRLAVARVDASEAGLPADELLLRDWLLAPHYDEPLQKATSAIVQFARRKSLPALVSQLPAALLSLVNRHKRDKVPLEVIAAESGTSVQSLKSQLEQAMQALPQLFRDRELAEMESLFVPPLTT